MTSKRSNHRSSSWGSALTVVTVAMSCLAAAIVVRFALAEAQAMRELSALAKTQSTNIRSASMPIDLEAWLETNASKEDSDAWGRIFNEVRGGYIDMQLKNLWMSPSDTVEDRHWLYELDLEDPTRVAFAWQIEPDLVAEFIEFTQPLRQRIHQLSDDDGVIYFPLLHRGANTTLAELQTMLEVAKLIYLENEDAIRRKDVDGARRSLQTIDVLEPKLRYPVPGAVLTALQLRKFFFSALHRALDAEMIPPDEWPVWMDRLRNRPDLRVAYQRFQVAARLQSLVQPEPDSRDWNREQRWQPVLASQQLREFQFPNVSNEQLIVAESRFLLLQDYQQSAFVRLALLRYMHEKNRLPQRLSDLPSSWITADDWTNREGKELSYVLAEDQTSASLSMNRFSTRNFAETVPLSAHYGFRLTSPQPDDASPWPPLNAMPFNESGIGF